MFICQLICCAQYGTDARNFYYSIYAVKSTMIKQNYLRKLNFGILKTHA